jgi:PadR family transcriptional regulator AphA
MPRMNKTRFALLGILSAAPASGYDIKKKMAQSTNHFWREGDSSIYPILKQLLEEGMANCELLNIESDKPKKVYTITSEGKNELDNWLMEDPILLQNKSEFMLKIFFGWNVDIKITISHIEKFRRQVKVILEKHRHSAEKVMRAKLTNTELFEFLTLKAGIAYYEASLHWSNEALRLLKANLNASQNNKLSDHF